MGDEAFRKELLAQMDGCFDANHYATERHESAVEKGERLLRDALARWGMKAADRVRRAGREQRKLQLAVQWRAETTLRVAWIAERLKIGSAQYLSNKLSRLRRR